MISKGKIPITAELANSLKTLPIASKTGDTRSYHPSYRSLSVIIDEGQSQETVQTLPSFLVIESGPFRRAMPGSIEGRSILYFRVSCFDDAVTAYGDMLEE